MGQYINVGNENFKRARQSEYIDKSELISYINSDLGTEANMWCVTRCRRFGKSMAANMLCAYYDKSCDSRALFQDLKIAKDPNFEKHLNKYPVIYISMSDFISQYGHDTAIVNKVQQALIGDILQAYPSFQLESEEDLMGLLLRIVNHTGEKFLMIIDEWDAICREFKDGESVMDEYVNYLRRLFKGINTARVFVGAYITGILPIKRYNTESALNNFQEYTMIQPEPLSTFYGFTQQEVKELCEKYGMPEEEIKQWYDGYQIGEVKSMYNPNSVVTALKRHKCNNYWSNTGAFDDISNYIQRNYEGLKDAIIDMLAGGRCTVDYGMFNNDLKDISNRDDVLTVLIHLGYLAYDPDEFKCYIPNNEVREMMRRAVKNIDWKPVNDAISASENLLKAVIKGDCDSVAAGLEKVHQRETSILSYNDENSLSCVIALAFYTARNKYHVHREFASGKGYADVAFIPRENVDLPALIIELKYNKDADTAIDQIRRRDYPDKLREYANNILLVGINYDPLTKTHTCRIEKA